MQEPRTRKRDAYRCAACQAGFWVTYFDDRVGERALLPVTIARAACPSCGHARTVSLPAGAERTLLVEPRAGDQPVERGRG